MIPSKILLYGITLSAVVIIGVMSVQKWHYIPLAELTGKVEAQAVMLGQCKTDLKLTSELLYNKAFECEQGDELLKAKEKLNEADDINTSLGEHTFFI